MLDAYSESRSKSATWKVMFEMDDMLKVGSTSRERPEVLQHHLHVLEFPRQAEYVGIRPLARKDICSGD